MAAAGLGVVLGMVRGCGCRAGMSGDADFNLFFGEGGDGDFNGAGGKDFALYIDPINCHLPSRGPNISLSLDVGKG